MYFERSMKPDGSLNMEALIAILLNKIALFMVMVNSKRMYFFYICTHNIHISLVYNKLNIVL